MNQNPYEPSTADPPTRFAGVTAGLPVASISGNCLLALSGLAIAALSQLPSDIPGFFLLAGVHLIVCAALGVSYLGIAQPGAPRNVFCWLSIVANTALIARLVLLIMNDNLRGPLAMLAPSMLGIPAALNILVAVWKLDGIERLFQRESP